MRLRRADQLLGTALVTGACSGIGLEMARILGSLGYTLVLVSHRAGPLSEAAAEIGGRSGAPVYSVVLDLARAEAAGELFEAVGKLGVEVDILINNAGMFFFGEAADADPAQANRLLQLHVVTPSLLLTRFAAGMRARGRGHVLFVSSLSAVRDFPGIGYYGSSKKYLRGFARAMRSELGVHGVNVTCLLPGATATGLYDPEVVPVGLAKRLGVMMEPAAVARAGLLAMFAGEAESMPGALTRVMAAAAVVAPQAAIDWIRKYGPWMPPRGPR
jgi:short-subunit dehydrogenase